MSRRTKIILAVLALAVVVACLWLIDLPLVFMRWWSKDASQRMVADARLAQETAARFAEFELPAGWQPAGVGHSLGVTIVLYGRADGRGLIQFRFARGRAGRAELSPLARLMWKTQERYLAAGLRMQPVGEMQAVIRGQSVTLPMSQGTGLGGAPYRLVIGAFQGREGPAMVLFYRPVNDWNQDEVDAFLASIR